MRQKTHSPLFVLVALTLVSLACQALSGTGATATPLPITQPATQPEGKLEIASTNSYIDSFNEYNVSGEVVNNTNHVVANITLSLTITDESGTSLLKDENDNPVDQLDIQPYFPALAPGESTPFTYYISADEVQPAKYEVTIKSFDQSPLVDAEPISTENMQMTTLPDGDIVLTGEIVNQSAENIDIEAMAGSVLDEAGTVLAANSPRTYTRSLYPTGDANGRDRGPFLIKIYGPLLNVSRYKVTARAVKSAYEMSTDLSIQLTGSYFDKYGDYHLLGTVTNNGSNQVSPSVIGGLYNADQAVFDAASSSTPFYLNQGESSPFDITSFEVINSLPENQTSPSEKIVKPDFFWTFTTEYEVMALQKSELHLTEDEYAWTADGTVTNTSGRKLNTINVLVQCLGTESQTPVFNSTSIFPKEGSDVIQPDETSDFSIGLYLPVDVTKLDNCQASFQGVSAE